MSSAHRVLGRPGRRCACNCGMSVGSRRAAVVVQFSSVVVAANFCAHLHFRCLWVDTQSSMLSLFILASASWVHLFIQSAHGSRSSVVSSLRSWSSVSCMLCWFGGLLSTSSSVCKSQSVNHASTIGAGMDTGSRPCSIQDIGSWSREGRWIQTCRGGGGLPA